VFRGEERVPLEVAPELGEHNDEIYRGELGLGDAELDELRGLGVV
jgi:hypothetical protein